ncbi:MAG TPA: hypothetical protein VHE34_08145 [Puia sp.]|uniref:hypothetical protein n=1 Tax=Puia sp. TaxID=2045100 RepID=UPI002CA5BF66|nr:hypothetical protein [Puia sp.]HVU95178.1 hypothetical protein [Puia sp.]
MIIQTNRLQPILCLSLALSFLRQSTLAQPTPADSIPAARAAIFYQSYIGQDAAIYNGVAYQPDYRGIEGNPWFESPNLVSGSLVYEDLTYTHIPLMYDLVLDDLVIADPKGQTLILAPEKVQQFTLGNHTFIYQPANRTPGFYERLSSGYASLYVRHKKKIEEKLESAQLLRFISSHDDYILFKQEHYYPVPSANHLLTLLSDKKQQLRQFQHAQHIRFKKDPAAAMQAIVDHYNQLPH